MPCQLCTDTRGCLPAGTSCFVCSPDDAATNEYVCLHRRRVRLAPVCAGRDGNGPSGINVQGYRPTSPQGWLTMVAALKAANVSCPARLAPQGTAGTAQRKVTGYSAHITETVRAAAARMPACSMPAQLWTHAQPRAPSRAIACAGHCIEPPSMPLHLPVAVTRIARACGASDPPAPLHPTLAQRHRSSSSRRRSSCFSRTRV